MNVPMPGDMVIVAPKDQLTGYLMMPALYLGEEEIMHEQCSPSKVYLVLFHGKVVKVPARSHKVETIEGEWPSGGRPESKSKF